MFFPFAMISVYVRLAAIYLKIVFLLTFPCSTIQRLFRAHFMCCDSVYCCKPFLKPVEMDLEWWIWNLVPFFRAIWWKFGQNSEFKSKRWKLLIANLLRRLIFKINIYTFSMNRMENFGWIWICWTLLKSCWQFFQKSIVVRFELLNALYGFLFWVVWGQRVNFACASEAKVGYVSCIFRVRLKTNLFHARIM